MALSVLLQPDRRHIEIYTENAATDGAAAICEGLRTAPRPPGAPALMLTLSILEAMPMIRRQSVHQRRHVTRIPGEHYLSCASAQAHPQRTSSHGWQGQRQHQEPETKTDSPVQKPQGNGLNKRTPQSAFDPAAGKDIYEPEAIVGQRLAKGVTQYAVKWKECALCCNPSLAPCHRHPECRCSACGKSLQHASRAFAGTHRVAGMTRSRTRGNRWRTWWACPSRSSPRRAPSAA